MPRGLERGSDESWHMRGVCSFVISAIRCAGVFLLASGARNIYRSCASCWMFAASGLLAWHRILLAGVCGFSIDASSMTSDQKAAFGLQLSENMGAHKCNKYEFAVQLGNVLSTTHAQAFFCSTSKL